MSMLRYVQRNITRIAGSYVSTLQTASFKNYGTLLVACNRNNASKKSIDLVKNKISIKCNIVDLISKEMSTSGVNHSTLWAAERGLSLILLGVIPTAFLVPSQSLDALLAVSLVLHSHWGIEAMITDYVRPSVVGNIVPKVAHISLLLLSMATLGGLFYLIYNDIGIAKSVKKLWAVKGN